MVKYGTDKPDLRNPLEIVDVSDLFVDSSFKPFCNKCVRAIKVPGMAGKSKGFFEKMEKYALEIGMKGLGYFKVTEDYKYLGPIDKFLNDDQRLELKNRCIMAPMSAALANPDGTVSDELIAYFVARAKGGMGLIMTEYAFVQPNGRSSDHQISVAEDSMIPGLARLAEAVHENGAKICLQLQH